MSLNSLDSISDLSTLDRPFQCRLEIGDIKEIPLRRLLWVRGASGSDAASDNTALADSISVGGIVVGVSVGSTLARGKELSRGQIVTVIAAERVDASILAIVVLFHVRNWTDAETLPNLPGRS